VIFIIVLQNCPITAKFKYLFDTVFWLADLSSISTLSCSIVLWRQSFILFIFSPFMSSNQTVCHWPVPVRSFYWYLFCFQTYSRREYSWNIDHVPAAQLQPINKHLTSIPNNTICLTSLEHNVFSWSSTSGKTMLNLVLAYFPEAWAMSNSTTVFPSPFGYWKFQTWIKSTYWNKQIIYK